MKVLGVYGVSPHVRSRTPTTAHAIRMGAGPKRGRRNHLWVGRFHKSFESFPSAAQPPA
jgi:hypothetical protein